MCSLCLVALDGVFDALTICSMVWTQRNTISKQKGRLQGNKQGNLEVNDHDIPKIPRNGIVDDTPCLLHWPSSLHSVPF